ncbi:tyrosine-type recombinase/integrase [Streptomyces sp. CJ_13]|uniref:tyrosine-type recombinase/integrase n=1 Tax=Streptomyces sp. CJ_13 TaxID=2724943 RepID=UPI001BDD0A94|nr:tyrosine-type recombinase/integrase [Streptomyces sp. CJ_13]
MTTLAEVRESERSIGADPKVERFKARLDPQFLEETAGWDEGSRTLTIQPGQPLLAWTPCINAICSAEAILTSGLCSLCHNKWNRSKLPLDEFVGSEEAEKKKPRERCSVLNCARMWSSSVSQLCGPHRSRFRKLGLSMEEFFAHPLVKPMSPLGICGVLACSRERELTTSPYCQAHKTKWKRLVRDGEPEASDEARWTRTEAPTLTTPGVVSLLGLSPLLIAEVLFALQERIGQEVKVSPQKLRSTVNWLRRQEFWSLMDVPDGERTGKKNTAAIHARLLRDHVIHALLDPEVERRKPDRWDARAWGHRGALVFTGISQKWLREAAMIWIVDELPRHYGKSATRFLQAHIGAVGRLSKSLRAFREDCGEIPTAVDRADIENFLGRLTFQVSQHDSDMTENLRWNTLRMLRKLLNGTRALGASRPGGPMAGVSEDFALRETDVPKEDKRKKPRDLPAVVMRQVCGQLDQLEEAASREVRVAIDLMIDTGRRPDEICTLEWDCLATDSKGKYELIWTNIKCNRLGIRLPIAQATVDVIRNQQQRVRARFPETPLSELVLLPAPIRNPRGTRSVAMGTVGERHSEWVAEMPPLLMEDGKTEFDRSKVVMYAYRHSYAQRHADAGVPIDQLRKLMDHDLLESTRRYYRVTEERTRKAVDTVARFHFDRHGNRIWREARQLMESEHMRRGLESVPVPFGGCEEPSNVQAGGGECPIRFRCVGCDHFNTDVSYLPDLERYLSDLLQTRERIAALTTADEWAKAEAMPSEHEIQRVRRLIANVKESLAELEIEEQDQVQEATVTIRKSRAVMLGMPRVGQAVPDVRPERP